MTHFRVTYVRPPGAIVLAPQLDQNPIMPGDLRAPLAPIMPEGFTTHSGAQPLGVPIMPERWEG